MLATISVLDLVLALAWALELVLTGGGVGLVVILGESDGACVGTCNRGTSTGGQGRTSIGASPLFCEGTASEDLVVKVGSSTTGENYRPLAVP